MSDLSEHIIIGPLDPIKWFNLALFIVETNQQEREEQRKNSQLDRERKGEDAA